MNNISEIEVNATRSYHDRKQYVDRWTDRWTVSYHNTTDFRPAYKNSNLPWKQNGSSLTTGICKQNFTARAQPAPAKPSSFDCHEYSCYCKTSNISCTLVGNKIADHSDVVGASPVDAAPTASSFSTKHLASRDCAKTTARRDEKHLSSGILCGLY